MPDNLDFSYPTKLLHTEQLHHDYNKLEFGKPPFFILCAILSIFRILGTGQGNCDNCLLILCA